MHHTQPLIPEAEIDAITQTIVSRFHPEQIILFGSYAYGQPTVDSDLDFLVIMPYEGSALDIACDIRCSITPYIPVDILVRKPENILQSYREFDPFIRHALDKGKLLYEQPPAKWLEIAEEDYRIAIELLENEAPHKWRAICFHAQQAAEKYIKGILILKEQSVPKIHDLLPLSHLLKAVEIHLDIHPVELVGLSTSAVTLRYPGDEVTLSHALRSVEACQTIRNQLLPLFNA